MKLRSRVAFAFFALIMGTSCHDTGRSEPEKSAAGASSAAECAGVDDTDLQATVECFYSAKSGVGLYRFLSNAYQAEVTQAEVEAWDRSVIEWAPVTVTKREDVQGASYAAVSGTKKVTTRERPCTLTKTATWIREGGHWRRLGGIKKFKEMATRKFDDGDYSGAAEAATEWLKVDPLSITAYSLLAWSVYKGAPDKSTDDTTRAMLGINAADSEALSTAAAVSSNEGAAVSYLERMRLDDCNAGNVVFSIALDAKPRAALELLERFSGLNDCDLVLARIHALRKLDRNKEVAVLLDHTTSGRVRARLDSSDKMFAANWSAEIAEALLSAGDGNRARSWAAYGVLRDPKDARLAAVLRATNPGP